MHFKFLSVFILAILCTVIGNSHARLHGAQLLPTFSPPKGWECVTDPKQRPQKVLLVCVGTGKGKLAPSINLTSEITSLDLSSYMNKAKSYHETQGITRCHFLGAVPSPAGTLQLLQIDRQTEWGQVRFLQAFLINQQIAYVITATCLNDEFGALAPHLLKAIQSFHFISDLPSS